MHRENNVNYNHGTTSEIADELHTPILDVLRPNTSKNVKEYIKNMDEEIRKMENDDKYVYLGSIDHESQLSQLDLTDMVLAKKVPYVWVKSIYKFMYLVNWIWTDNPELSDGTILYRDEDIAIQENDGELVMMTFKDISEIHFDVNKITNLICVIRGYEKSFVEIVMECLLSGWSIEAIASMNEIEEMEDIEMSDIEQVYNDLEYWSNLTINVDDPVQISTYEDEVEQEYENIDMVETVTNKHEGLVLTDELESYLQMMDMAEIYNEIVEERLKDGNNEITEEDIKYDPDDDDEEEYDEYEEEVDYDDEECDEYQSYMLTDIFAEGVMTAMVRPNSRIQLPHLFSKMSADLVEDTQMNYIVMEDDTETTESNLFTDQDLLSLVKFRLSCIKEHETETGELPFMDNTALNNAIDKIIEAQMWLDLWSKLN